MQQKSTSMVSIIVPVYNTENYLRECLTSIERQTYTNYEVIMINDGSTDGSELICDEFSKRDNRFLLINQNNSGVCAARTRGIKESRGELVSFIDSDDTVERNFIEILCRKIKDTGADVVQCNRDINGIKEYPHCNEHLYAKKEIMLGFLNFELFNTVTLKMYKKSIIRDIPFPEDRPIMEDAAWSAMVYEKCNALVSIPDTLYHYRMVATSLIHKKMSEKQECGKFRNLIDKALIIEKNIDGGNSYELLNQFVQSFLPWILGSHDNLMLYDTYKYLQQLIDVLCIRGVANELYSIVLRNSDFRKAQREYVRTVCHIRSGSDLKYRLKVLWRILKRR